MNQFPEVSMISINEKLITAVNEPAELFVANILRTYEQIEIFYVYFWEFSNRSKLRNCYNNKLRETRKIKENKKSCKLSLEVERDTSLVQDLAISYDSHVSF